MVSRYVGITSFVILAMRYAVLLIALFSGAAMACSFPPRTSEELFNGHSKVFHAVLTKTELSSIANPRNGSEPIAVVIGTYKLIESFKGTVPEMGKVKDLIYGPGNCSLGLLVGTHYIFYPEENGFVLLPSGSWAFFNPDGAEVKAELEKLRKLKVGEK